jgi:serine/threonine protein kinase
MILSQVAEGSTLGNRYIVKRSIGRGGMAAVYLAYDPRLDLDVALKVLPPFVAADPTFVSRFRREGQTLAALTHPYILRLYDIHEDEASALYFLVLEHLTGGTLKDRLTGSPWPLQDSLGVLVPVAEALDFAHGRPAPVVHRDLKPANVLFGEGDRVVVGDFGLARLLAPEGPDAAGLDGEERDRREASLSLSLSGGQVMGTPAYMAPEQAEGLVATPACDLYALGVLAYELLTGTVPFLAETPQGTLMQVLTRPLPLPTVVNPTIDAPVERVLLKALAKDPANRFRSARELVQALLSAGQVTIVPSRLAGAPSGTTRLPPFPEARPLEPAPAPPAPEVPTKVPDQQIANVPSPRASHPNVSGAPGTPALRPVPQEVPLGKAAPGPLAAKRPFVSRRRLVQALGAVTTVLLVLTLVRIAVIGGGQGTHEGTGASQAIGVAPAAARGTSQAQQAQERDQAQMAATGTAGAGGTATARAAQSAQAAVPTVLAAEPTQAPTARALTGDDAWQETELALEGVWGRDWPAAVAVLDAFRATAPEHDAAKQKLYAALVDYARTLLQGGDTPKAAARWVRARDLLPGRPEAPQLLRALTPTPTPAPAITATPIPPAQAAPSGGSSQASGQANAQMTAQVQTATALAASARQLQLAQETAVAQQTAAARALANADATAATARSQQTAAAGQTATVRAVADVNATATARAQQTAVAAQTFAQATADAAVSAKAVLVGFSVQGRCVGGVPDPDRVDLRPTWRGSFALSGFSPNAEVSYQFSGTRIWCGKPRESVGNNLVRLSTIPNVLAQGVPTRFDSTGSYTFDFMLDHGMFGMFTYCFVDSAGKRACVDLNIPLP